eukprot:2725299-Amphidinium_carterae.1
MPQSGPLTPLDFLELLERDWTAPVHSQVRFDGEGVFLVTGQDPLALGKSLQGNKHAYVLVSLTPIPTALRTEKISFRAKFVSGARRLISEKLLVGYANHFGGTTIQHKFVVKHVQVPSSHTSVSTSLVCRSKQQAVLDEEWTKVKACVDPKSFQAYLESADVSLSLLDVFRIKVTDGEYYAMLRVESNQVQSWLEAPLPFSFTPVGEKYSSYRVHWERDLHTFHDMRDRHVEVPGYSGVILGKDGLGVRIMETQFTLAMQYLGKPAGALYAVSGIPVEVSREAVEAFLGSHVSGAVSEPPYDTLSAQFGYTRAQVRVQLQSGRKERQVADKQAVAPPSSWQESAKRAIGPQSQTTSPEEVVEVRESEPGASGDEAAEVFDAEMSEDSVPPPESEQYQSHGV